jgi:hypothetical protein
MVCGTAVGVLEPGAAQCAASGGDGGGLIDVPVTACGTTVGILGSSAASCDPSGPSNPSGPSDPGAGGSHPGGTADHPGQAGVVPAHFLQPAVVGGDAAANPGAPRAASSVTAQNLAYTGLRVGALAGTAALLMLLGAAVVAAGRRSVVAIR